LHQANRHNSHEVFSEVANPQVYRASVLTATGMGLRIYAPLGFREVCKLSFWKYGKMRQQTKLTEILRLVSGMARVK
jgi:hypothetical protein